MNLKVVTRVGYLCTKDIFQPLWLLISKEYLQFSCLETRCHGDVFGDAFGDLTQPMANL